MLSKTSSKLLKKGKTQVLVAEPAPLPEILWAQPGRSCWCHLPLPDCFFKARIVSRDEDEKKVTVTYENANPALANHKILAFSKIMQCEEEEIKEGYEDMVQMNCLNEAELVYNLKKRYKLDIIYSFIGPTLLFVNPYKPMPQTYSESIIDTYYALIQEPVWSSKEKPHVYAVASKATHRLLDQEKNQAIVISGESGAGKTENTKYALKFLTYFSSRSTNTQAKGTQISIEEKILSSNPILEAFGNAKTIRNDNSSRFGKYMRINFNKKSKQIEGVEIKNYLLEKSRVTNQSKDERNYHIFYQLLRSKNNDKLKQLGLVNHDGNPMQLEEFNLLKNSDLEDTYEDFELYKNVCESFGNLGFSKEEEEGVWNYVSSVLLLGNIEFDDTNYKNNEGIKPCDIKNEKIIDIICKLMGFDKANFLKSLLYRRIEIQRQITETSINKNECETLRNSLCKQIYERLFIWLTKRINMNNDKGGFISIGLLDIFGFEKFGVNSLEQLCINYTNEKLHQLYIEYVFKSEKAELMEQGLTHQANHLSTPKDNIEIILLIEKIFGPIDESAANNKFALANLTDEKSLKKIQEQNMKNPFFKSNPKKHDIFIVLHTADEVEYDIKGFKSKNQNFFPKDIEDVLLNSKNETIKNIYLGTTPSDKQSSKIVESKVTLLQKFKKEMGELMEVLIQCEVHFIRCLKPNIKKLKDEYQADYILQQINYLGVLESIKIRKEGFPYRKDYKRFLLDNSALSINSKLTAKVNALNDKDELRKLAWNLLRNIIVNEKDFFDKVLYGRDKINLKQELATQLDKIMLDKNRKKIVAARVMMRQYRIYVSKKNWKENTNLIKAAFLMISKTYKGHFYRKKYLLKRERAIRVQSLVRMKIARKAFISKKMAIKTLNETFRKNRKKKFLENLRVNNVFFKKWREIDQRITLRGFFKRYYQNIQIKKKFLAAKKANEQKHALKLMNKFLEGKILAKLFVRLRKDVQILKRFKKASMRLKGFRIGIMMQCFLLIKMAISQNFIEKTKQKNEQAVEKQNLKEKNIMKIQNFYRKKNAKARLNRIILRNTELRLHHTNDSMIVNRVTRLINEKQIKKGFRALKQAYEADLKEEACENLADLLYMGDVNSRLFGEFELKTLKTIKKQLFSNQNKTIGFENENTASKRSFLYECFFLSKSPEMDFLNPPLSDDVKHIPELPPVDMKRSDVRKVSIWDQLFKKNATNDEKHTVDEKKEENDKKNLKKIRSLLKHFSETKVESKQWICAYDIVTLGFNLDHKIREEIFHQIYVSLSESKSYEKYVSLLSVVATSFKVSENFFYLFMRKIYDLYSKNPNADNNILRYCSKTLERSWNSEERLSLLSKEELWNVWRMKKSRIMININKTLSFCYFIEIYCTVKELLEMIIANLGIESISKYVGLYLDFSGISYFLSEDKILFDEIDRLKEKSGNKNIPNIYLRIKIISNKALEDDNYLILRYSEILENYLIGKYEITMEEVYELGSLAFLVEKKKYTGEEVITGSTVCPANKFPPKDQIMSFSTHIFLLFKHKSDIGLTRKEAMLKFLSQLERFEMNSIFYGNYGIVKLDKIGKIVQEEFFYNVYLHIKEKNLAVTLSKELKQNEEKFYYKKIKMYGSEKIGKFFVFRVAGIHDEVHIFESEKSIEIEGILEGYLSLLN